MTSAGRCPDTLERRPQPRVSVVLIFLNAERYLREAIASVSGQTFPAWELILVDDGSTDGSTAIARAQAVADPKVRYADHPGHTNCGMSASRNLGASLARGEYLTFIDADDVWEARKLAEQVAVLDARPDVGLVVGALNYWYSWQGAAAGEADRIVLTGDIRDEQLNPPEALLRLYPLGPASAAGTDLMVRRAVFQAVGGFEGTFRGLYEDQAFLCKIYLIAPIFISAQPWLWYRQHPQSCVATTTGDYWDHRGRFLAWFDAYLDGRTVDVRVRRALGLARQTVTREQRRRRLATWSRRLGLEKWRVLLFRVVRRFTGAEPPR